MVALKESVAVGFLRNLAILLFVLIVMPPPALAQFQEDADANAPSSETPELIPLPADIDFETAHQDYMEKTRLQLTRPEFAEEEAEFTDPVNLPNWLLSIFSTAGQILQIVFYVGLAIIIGYILYHVLTTLYQVNLKGFARKKSKQYDEDDVQIPFLQPDEAEARSLLREADALARDGRFAEAVHLLLFRSIEDIQTRRNKPLPKALTSREIGALDGLPQRPRLALGPIIALVERSFFGGYTVDQTGWTKARAAYEAFAFGEAWT